MFTPSITGVVGYQTSSDDYYEAWNGFSEYWYWNAGLALAVEKLTFDFRYWGTDASNTVPMPSLHQRLLRLDASYSAPRSFSPKQALSARRMVRGRAIARPRIRVLKAPPMAPFS